MTVLRQLYEKKCFWPHIHTKVHSTEKEWNKYGHKKLDYKQQNPIGHLLADACLEYGAVVILIPLGQKMNANSCVLVVPDGNPELMRAVLISDTEPL